MPFLLVALCTIACGKKLPIVEENTPSAKIDAERILGEWFIESGKPLPVNIHNPEVPIYCQCLDFSKKAFKDTFKYAGGYKEQDSTFYSVWEVVDSTIYLGTWDCDHYNLECKILEIGDGRMKLSFDGQVTSFYREEVMLNSVSEKIIGKWYVYISGENEKGWNFRENGTCGGWSKGWVLDGAGQFTYELSGNVFYLESQYRNPTTLVVEYINDSFACIYGVDEYPYALPRETMAKNPEDARLY